MLLFPRLPAGKQFCLGSDWYRFPTSFLLPDDTELAFIESDFKGLLPGMFNTTRSIPHMNNLNQWDPTKVIHEGLCECLIFWKEGITGAGIPFVDREQGRRVQGEYGVHCYENPNARRLNALGLDLMGRNIHAADY
jgi:hypothetical protein